jgi:hypothetical protein
MLTYQRIGLVLAWVLSLVIVGAIASAQTRRDPGEVISGNDIGFRPEGWRGTARTGTWVVRINGQWVDASAAPAVRPATQ